MRRLAFAHASHILLKPLGSWRANSCSKDLQRKTVPPGELPDLRLYSERESTFIFSSDKVLYYSPRQPRPNPQLGAEKCARLEEHVERIKSTLDQSNTELMGMQRELAKQDNDLGQAEEVGVCDTCKLNEANVNSDNEVILQPRTPVRTRTRN